ncbi:sulfite exporter TauE/SafE family protein [Rhizobium sp. RM]|uniref:sulfite exporter TauE/SafE family protein n=1 Tax=Rhizobium/Agrobacterium group TaxID=227290 RepID=UPI00110D4DC1|nr:MULTISPECIES: sulfite exporter TauE/SafE family protein [Rhizobium/Agrobacterium group]NWJ23263.1 sulfite exporter TauE/SafE family protein [Rhizobium sp. RM]TMV14138.1 sulfite exporter TauE/SafE family protein [Rhizobium sp. Td3]UXS02567.1 sulfite exporter TauE/SafE family protein [Agrobacterium tumefaciens]
MSIFIVLLLFATGFLSGVVNAIAGGGTFLTFGAMTLAGLPPIVANATSAIVQFPGYITSVIAYGPEIRKHWREAILLSAVSVVGGLAGALLLLSLDNPSFRQLVPWLLLAATAVFAAGPWLRPRSSAERSPGNLPSLVFQGLASVYGGFFGAGMGIMMLAILGVTSGGSYHHLNALKNLLSVVIAIIAITIFVSGGVVSWWAALIMFPAAALGGYAGVHAARRVPQWIIRWLVIAVGLVLTGYYFLSA